MKRDSLLTHLLCTKKNKNILRIMKITFFLSFVCVFQIFALTGSAQNATIHLSSNQLTIGEFFGEIEQQTDYLVVFSNSEVDIEEAIRLNKQSGKVADYLEEAFKDKLMNVEFENNYIILSKKTIKSDIQQTGKNIRGTVTDERGEPIIGANIVEKGTTNGVVTNIDGEFSITARENTILQISYIGYISQEIPVSAQTTVLSIILKEDAQALDEVVVVGYGIQKKVNLTGSVSSVNFADQADTRPITNVSSALAGLSSGVSVMQGSGQPGEDKATIRVRGMGTLNNSDPLIIIDGMEGDMNILNPSDIESVSVLKDAASASIYGSRAANGVVLITTKKGNKDRINVHYSGNVSISKPVNLVDLVSDYPQYMRLMNESNRNIGSADIFSEKTITAWEEANRNPNALNEIGIPNRIAYPNTNWQKEMYQDNIAQNHSLSVDGGTDKTSFLFSIGYMDNPGLVENTGVQRYTFRANLNVKVTDWLNVGTNTYATLQSKELGDFKSMNDMIGGTSPGVTGKYKGQYGFPESSEESSQTDNMYAFLNRYGGKEESARFNTTVYSKIRFMEGLTWDFNFNYSRRFDEYNRHSNANPRIRFSTGEVMSPATDPSLMTTNLKNTGEYSYTLENILRYTKTIAHDHDLNVLVGYNEYYYKKYDHESTKRGLIDPSIYTPGSATEMIEIKGGAKDRALRSVFGRINYAYQSRYLLEANMRYDGSSRFSSDSRWGVFPSFAAAWRLSEESFMENTRGVLDNLKIRASWGQLGNNGTGDDNLGEYDYQAVYGTVKYPLNGVLYTGLRPKKMANYMMKWETTAVTNIGVDANLFNNRLSAEIDVYHKLTDAILTTPPIYMTVGDKTAPTRNTAEVTNKGIEVTIGWKDKIDQLNFSISGNFAYNNNEVSKYKGKLTEGWEINEKGEKIYKSNLGDVSDSKDVRRVLEGHKINEYYLLTPYKGDQSYFNPDGSVNINGGPKGGMIRTEEDMKWLTAMKDAGYTFMPDQGISKSQIWYGDLIYADVNGDGIYGSSYDYKFTGTSNTPKYTFGLQMSAAWRDFDFSMIWAGSAGFDLYWSQFGFNQPSTGYGSAIGKHVADDHYFYNEGNSSAGTANNLNALYPRLKPSDNSSQNKASSVFYLYKGDYVKLKNLSLGYTLPQAVAQKIFTQRIRVYFSAENLFTITSYPGQDPEIGSNIGYPSLRQLSFGANITF